MGETLKREFSLEGVDTGRKTPDTSWDVPLSQGGGNITVPGTPITRPSFLQSFLANLGPALSYGVVAHGPNGEQNFGTGLAGALGGIETYDQRQFENQLSRQHEDRLAAAQQTSMALEQAQLGRLQQLTPLETQQKQMDIERQQGILNLANQPALVDQMLGPMAQSLGTLSPDEQAVLDSGKAATLGALKQGKFDVTPYSEAVSKIAQNRLLGERKVKGPAQVQYDSGIPVSVRDKDGTTYDVNDPNLPDNLKPLVASANKAHKQKVQEGIDQQARAFAQQTKLIQDRLDIPTTATRTMAEKAPKVKALVAQLRIYANADVQGKGPLRARWADFWNGKVGAPNPQYSKMRVDDGLLATALMQMHVGARGGERIMEHFSNLLALGHQSPQNYRAALDAIDEYADDVAKEGKGGSTGKSSGLTIKRDKNGRIIGVE